jgi:hypothetical protein
LKKAGAALATFDSIEKVRYSGSTATVILKEGGVLDQTKLTEALAGKGLKFESMTAKEMDKPVVHYTMKAKGVSCADTGEKVRVALEAIDGVAAAYVESKTDLFLSKEVEMTEAKINEVLKSLNVSVSEVTKKDAVEF